MTIKKLFIENFRSIERLDLDLGPMNALIGPNNAGKSTILAALNTILGETWPTRPFDDADAHDRNRQPITIRVLFDRPLRCDQNVGGFSLSCQPGDQPEYLALDTSGNYFKTNYPKRVTKDLRSEAMVLYLGVDRQAERQLRPSQWTLFGKLLARIEDTIPAAEKAAFQTAVSKAVQTHVHPSLVAAEKVVDQYVTKQTGLKVQMRFDLLHSMALLKNIRPFIIEGSSDYDAEEVGAGVQSALAVAIAKAYAEVVKQPLVLAIEEPELYLHPHGCRHFFRLLQELSTEGLQILYSTHERSFVSVGRYEDIHLVRRSPGAPTQVSSGRALSLGASAPSFQIQSKFNERLNEVFFATAVVLVEGDADEIACKCAFDVSGVALDQRNISIIGVGGVTEIPLIAQLLRAGFNIPTFAVIDEDPGNTTTADVRTKLHAIIGTSHVFEQSPNIETVLGLPKKPSRLDAMTQFPGRFAGFGHAGLPAVYQAIVAAVTAVA